MEWVGLAIIINNQSLKYKHPLQASIFTAEAITIYNTLKYNHTEYTNTKTKFIILSDSLSNLIVLTNTQNTTDVPKIIQ